MRNETYMKELVIESGPTEEMLRYYSIQRPVGPGTYPRKDGVIIHNFCDKTYCKEIGREAWGYIDYTEPLTEKEMSTYELMQSEGQAKQQGADAIDIFMGIVNETVGALPSLSPMEKLHGKVVESRMRAYHDVTIYEDGYEDWSYIGE